MNQSILGLVVGIVALAVAIPFGIIGFRARLSKFRGQNNQPREKGDTDE